MSYTAETIPVFSIYEALTKYWSTDLTQIPRPLIHDIGKDSNTLRVNLESFINSGKQDLVVIRPGSPTLREVAIGNHTYGNRESKVTISIYSRKDRQRIYDMMREIRRILHLRRHVVEGYQRVTFESFTETTDEELMFWIGNIDALLENNAVLLETS